MKTSNAILLTAGGVIAGAIIVLAIVARAAFGAAFAGPTPAEYSSAPGELKDFTAIRSSAVWELDVRRGDAYSVKVNTPKEWADDVIVRKTGDTLELGLKREGWRAGGYHLRAQITLPALTALEFAGVANVHISGFKIPALRVESSGAGAIVCRDSSIDRLTVILSGVGSVDFSRAPSVNADVELSGLGSLKLNMAGGDLNGSLSGLGSIEYTGEVKAERIDKSGLGSIKRH